ncbi:MAG: esterase-like activity of phytase family protein [Planctomycetes bacterium]|nr:esterase-like activity of phytase family protein [Planctomycetota bacterium]
MNQCAIVRAVFVVLTGALSLAVHAEPTLVSECVIPGDAADATEISPGVAPGPNVNRLGLFSDLYWDPVRNEYYSIADRGPGGGMIGFDTRVHKITFTLDSDTGTIAPGSFAVEKSIRFTDHGVTLNGFRPNDDPENKKETALGRSFDPEGFVVGPAGTFFVSDEYGPVLKEFNRDGKLLRTFVTPKNILPIDAEGNTNYVATRAESVVSVPGRFEKVPALKAGRQDNRGFEGLAINPAGTRLYAMLQDPLVNEFGRSGRNVRIVEFDVAAGSAKRQFVYQLEDIADINRRIPDEPSRFAAKKQGRNIGISALTTINDHEFLVLERDNHGLGVDGDTAGKTVGSKRIYKIDITAATDVSVVVLSNTTNALPPGVVPVSKALFLDIHAALRAAGKIIPEKIEGMTIGPRLNDGSYVLLLGTDNDFSVSQDESSALQHDVGTKGSSIPLGGKFTRPGETLIPSYFYSFRVPAGELADLRRSVASGAVNGK